MIKTLLYAIYLTLMANYGATEFDPEALQPETEEAVEPLAEVEDTDPQVVQAEPEAEPVVEIPVPIQTVPDYFLFQGVRSDIAQTQTYGLSFALSIEMNNWSRNYIASTGHSYADLKVACIGDSMTAGVGGDKSYPQVVSELLGGAEVYNMGVGGSGIGEYAAEPMFTRYQTIPKDVDVIVVSSGINDSFALEEYRAEGFRNDLSTMLNGLLTEYPNAKVMYLIQPPSLYFDTIKAQNPNLLTQEAFRREILLRCLSLGIEAIDLYNTNCMNPYDSQVKEAFYSEDEVHPRNEGYEVIGAIVAARIAIWAENTR